MTETSVDAARDNAEFLARIEQRARWDWTNSDSTVKVDRTDFERLRRMALAGLALDRDVVRAVEAARGRVETK